MQTPNDDRHDFKVLRLPQVEELTGLRRSAIYRLIQSNEFPKPIPLTQRCSGWLLSECRDWIEKRAAQRGQHAA